MIEGIVTEKDSFQSSEGSLVLASCSLLLCYDFIQMYNLCETLLFDAHCILTWSKFGKREVRCQQLMKVKPFHPNINMHILHTCAVNENLFNNQELLMLVIISFILMTLLCDSVSEAGHSSGPKKEYTEHLKVAASQQIRPAALRTVYFIRKTLTQYLRSERF
ncbi:hypothetical protein pdam_00004951 [Pocillopora damicornis]|uniref:Uncharacterized protein n=1 Tax=Pocillopora damicornis TaxID=46731 RepID=A0A3M6UVR6_POCDA|nr:hypothetical protein pdam_00004951 [Pocillopora damicornis]